MDLEALTLALDHHDNLLRRVAADDLSFGQFLEQYDNFYWSYALDGHESEPSDGALTTLASRIEPHRRVAEEILAALASEALANQQAYRLAGRIGPEKALGYLKQIATTLPASVA